MKAFIRAADYSAQDDFVCPDPGCGSKNIKIEHDIIVRVWCADCERVIADIDASEWRGRYEPSL